MKKKITTIIANLVMLGLDIVSLYSLMFNRSNLSNLTFALASTMLFISVPLFVYMNYTTFAKKISFEDDENNVNNFDTKKEFEVAFQKYRQDRVLKRFAEVAVRQLSTLEHKEATIDQIIRQNFSQDVSEFTIVSQVLEDSKEAVYSNLREIYNRMTVYGGTSSYGGTNLSGKVAAEQTRLMSEHIEFIASVLNNNEIIFLELDKLMVEITKMGSKNGDSIERIRGIVGSLQSLHSASSDDYDEIAKKYDNVQAPELMNQGTVQNR